MSKRWWQEESAAEAGFDFETANDGGDDDDADYVKTGPYIGRAVRRTFGRGVVSYGVVVSWLPHEKNEGQAFFRVRHDDGDEEDLDEAEVDAAAADAEAHPRAAPARDAGDDAAADAAPRPSLGDGDVAPAAPAAVVAAFGDVADDAAPEARAAAALAACWKGLEFLGGLGASEPALAGFGADLCLTFHDVATTAPDPLRALALYHVERLAQRWKGAHEAALDVAQIEPVEVCDLLAGVVAVARAGAAHASLKMECKAVADRVVGARGKRRAADAFLSADVLGKPIGDVNDSHRRAGRCRAATNAVLCVSLAERAEVPVGADEAEVWAWLDPLRPYAPYEAMGWEDWLDQLTLAVTLVAVASNDGALRLPPSLLPAEYALVADPATLRRCVKKRDVHLVGDVATCLRVFGAADDDARVTAARDFLVRAQVRDGVEAGSWPARDGDATSYAAYHAAKCAVRALYAPTFRGFGPSSPALRGVLRVAGDRHGRCGARVYGAKHVAKIADHYREENADVDAAARNFDLEERAARRLAGLLKWKRAMEARTIDDYDEGDERARKKRNKKRLR